MCAYIYTHKYSYIYIYIYIFIYTFIYICTCMIGCVGEGWGLVGGGCACGSDIPSEAIYIYI